jgi:hypothetical protein
MKHSSCTSSTDHGGGKRPFSHYYTTSRAARIERSDCGRPDRCSHFPAVLCGGSSPLLRKRQDNRKARLFVPGTEAKWMEHER